MQMINARNFLFGGGGYVILSIIARVSSALSSFIAIIKVSPASFGEYSYIQTTALMIGTVLSLSLQNSLVRPITSRDAGDRTTPAAVTASLIYALLCGVLVLAFISTFFDEPFHISAVVSTAMFAIVSAMYQGIFVGNDRSILGSFGALTSSVALLVFFTCFQYENTTQMLTAYTVSNLLGIVVVLSTAGKIFYFETKPTHLFQFVRRILFPAIGYGITVSIGLLIINFTNWYLQYSIISNGGPVANARFSTGLQIYNLFLFLPIVITPELIRRLQKKMALREIRTAFFYWVLGCVAFGLVTALGLLGILPVLPKLFIDSEAPIFILLLSGIINTSRLVCTAYCAIMLNKRAEMVSALMASSLVLVLSLIFTPTTELDGALFRLLGDSLSFVVLVTILFRNIKGVRA